MFLRFYHQFTIKTMKFQHTVNETFTKKKSLRDLTRFHGGLFELEILEIFSTDFLLINII